MIQDCFRKESGFFLIFYLKRSNPRSQFIQTRRKQTKKNCFWCCLFSSNSIFSNRSFTVPRIRTWIYWKLKLSVVLTIRRARFSFEGSHKDLKVHARQNQQPPDHQFLVVSIILQFFISVSCGLFIRII